MSRSVITSLAVVTGHIRGGDMMLRHIGRLLVTVLQKHNRCVMDDLVLRPVALILI